MVQLHWVENSLGLLMQNYLLWKPLEKLNKYTLIFSHLETWFINYFLGNIGDALIRHTMRWHDANICCSICFFISFLPWHWHAVSKLNIMIIYSIMIYSGRADWDGRTQATPNLIHPFLASPYSRSLAPPAPAHSLFPPPRSASPLSGPSPWWGLRA
jgi:hypothetical protein